MCVTALTVCRRRPGGTRTGVTIDVIVTDSSVLTRARRAFVYIFIYKKI